MPHVIKNIKIFLNVNITQENFLNIRYNYINLDKKKYIKMYQIT
jgi:hypothetical protein